MSALLYLGEFVFSTAADSINGLDISSEHRLAEQDVAQRVAPVQSLGPGTRSISIEGLILPEHQGGLGQIDALHAAADDGDVRACATGYGRFLGYFKIRKVNERDRFIAHGGLPRKIEFRIDLQRAPPLGGLFGVF